ncbi:hypothetical protein BCR42DRAFT_344717 [Absidia repens]|uniref:UBC core domain-containing protein n=1 Tax=Absidia repens TaxID=90262 RepID=A0A1X2ITI2_9FUNG|nr:hypothetical protein BCR42DRAFT_344717 [Absidia repens]
MSTPTFLNRMKKELADMELDPPPLITCYPAEDDITQLEAYLNGPPNTPYEKGLFRLDVNMPENYPFDPPMIRFRTPIYHPNIDECGRICASVLKKGKDDQWKPSMNLRTTLLSLHALIGEPNPDDPLDADIAREYQQDYDLFVKKAREHTKKHAIDMPDNLIPDPYSDTTDHAIGSGCILSTEFNDTSVTTSSKPKSKSKLSLSRKKQTDTQSQVSSSASSVTSSSQHSTTKTTVEGSDTTSSPSLHQKVTSISQKAYDEDEIASSNKGDGDQMQQTLNKHGNESNNDKHDGAELLTLENHGNGPRNGNTTHEKERDDDKCNAMEQPSMGNSHDEDELRDKGAKHEDGSRTKLDDTGYGSYNDKQDDQVNKKGDIAHHVICIDLDNGPNDHERLIHNKTTYTESEDCDDMGRQLHSSDMKTNSRDKSKDMDKGDDVEETGKICENTTSQLQHPLPSSSLSSSSSSPVDITSETASSMPNETSATVAPDKELLSPSTSPINARNSNDHSMEATQPPPLTTLTKNDTTSWTYTDHYSSQHFTFTTEDPFAEIFPEFEEDRPTPPKRKSKLSLSCKKKPKPA